MSLDWKINLLLAANATTSHLWQGCLVQYLSDLIPRVSVLVDTVSRPESKKLQQIANTRPDESRKREASHRCLR